MKRKKDALEIHFKKVDLKKPADLIMEQIRDLIHEGVLKPGDRLPSEKVLQERLGVNRYAVRSALQTMQLYGILKIVPQSGTYVAGIGPKALEGILTNVLKFQQSDYESLADVRTILEVRAAELAALLATEDEIQELIEALEDLQVQVRAGKRGLDEDFVLHLKIAEFSKSPVLISMISMIVPAGIGFSDSVHPDASHYHRAMVEHEAIVSAIREHDTVKAAAAMEEHMTKNHESTRQLLDATEPARAAGT